MDYLPSINVEPEGIDSWVNIMGGLWGYGVTLVALDGTEYPGFLGGIEWEEGSQVVALRNVDSDWAETNTVSVHPVDSLRAITIH